MQGKFRLCVVHLVGHSVQEDDPKTTAKHLYEFLYMFRIPQNKAD
jgi:protein phosphatase methylesterase 1